MFELFKPNFSKVKKMEIKVITQVFVRAKKKHNNNNLYNIKIYSYIVI